MHDRISVYFRNHRVTHVDPATGLHTTVWRSKCDALQALREELPGKSLEDFILVRVWHGMKTRTPPGDN